MMSEHCYANETAIKLLLSWNATVFIQHYYPMCNLIYGQHKKFWQKVIIPTPVTN